MLKPERVRRLSRRAAAEEARPTRGLAEAPLLLKRWFPSAGRRDSVARTPRAPYPERAEGSAGISGAQPCSAAAAEPRLSVTGTGRKYIGIVSGCAFLGESLSYCKKVSGDAVSSALTPVFRLGLRPGEEAEDTGTHAPPRPSLLRVGGRRFPPALGSSIPSTTTTTPLPRASWARGHRTQFHP